MKQAKRKIYVQTFSAFLAIYLVLMIGFAWFTLRQTAQQWNNTIRQTLSQHCNEIWDKLDGLTDESGALTDPTAFTAFMLNNLPMRYGFFNQEGAIFNRNYDVLFSTVGYDWIVNYSVPNGTGYSSAHASFSPEKWCSTEQIATLKEYLEAEPAPKKVGDLADYSVFLDQFRLDGTEAIPIVLSVTPMYADSFDENGCASSGGSARPEDTITFPDKGGDSKIFSGFLSAWRMDFLSSPMQLAKRDNQIARLQAEALDTANLEQYLGNFSNPLQSTLFSQHVYTLIPYKNTVSSVSTGDDTVTSTSDYYATFACAYNPFNFCKTTLYITWGACLLVFLFAATLLARGTYKTYQKQETLEKQRRETGIALAHDLKTPLAIIAGCAENLLENVHTEKRDYYAKSIQSKAMHMDKLLQQILQLSKLETGTIQKESVSLAELCTELIAIYQEVLQEKKLSFQLSGMQTISADVGLLKRVLENFFTNALRFTPPNGSITVTLSDRRFEIENSGSHISEDQRPTLWDAYHKADASRSDSEGSGLGLYFVAQILTLHHFSYGAENTDHGVQFWFRW